MEVKSGDRETRNRLLAAGARLFADRGFRRVTIRDLCREARANVAAVNYHFGDKLGLYRQVLGIAVSTMRATLAAARAGCENAGAEQRIRTYVQVFLERMVGSERSSWIHRVITREVVDPTPALDVIVQQAIRPRIVYLRTLVAELLSCSVDDDRVIMCAHSIHAQCVSVIPNPVAARLYPDLRMTPASAAALAEHITAFSVAGVAAMRAVPRKRKPSRARESKRHSAREAGRRARAARPRGGRQL
jgi:TetR/AcrR family transcriptional regulator, regulator of cefoperazone and chloramphenicol sensitivity